MSQPRAGDARDFIEFCGWLHAQASDSAQELLRVLLGEPAATDLGVALGRARRVVAAMTHEEQNTPEAIGPDRRAVIATEANVDIADVSELLLRFRAAQRLVRNRAEVRNLVLGGPASHQAPKPAEVPIPSALQDRLERDLRLWDFLSDADADADAGADPADEPGGSR
jgi:hypothetical protein